MKTRKSLAAHSDPPESLNSEATLGATDEEPTPSPSEEQVNDKCKLPAPEARSPELMNVDDLILRPTFSNLLPRDEGTKESIRQGMRKSGFDPSQPIHVRKTAEGYDVVDGHTRLEVAKEEGITHVPVFIHTFADEAAALAFAIGCQIKRRNLTDAQYYHLIVLYDTKRTPGSTQARTDGQFAPKVPGDALGKSAEQTGQKLGTSASKVERVRFIEKNGDPEIKDKIAKGKMTIYAAAEKIRRSGNDGGKTDEGTAKGSENPLSPFDALTDSDVAFASWTVIKVESSPLPADPSESQAAPTYAVSQDKLAITFKKKQIKQFGSQFGHRRVLVSPNIDIFDAEIPTSGIREILKAAAEAKEFEFLFATRNPSRLHEFVWHPNMFAGVSIFEQADIDAAEEHLAKLNAPRKWLLIEQLTMQLKFQHLDAIDWLVVRTRFDLQKAAPTPEALQSLLQQAWEAKCPVFFERGIAYRSVDPPKPLDRTASIQEGGESANE